MNERWVCKRCYADNEGEASACARCGHPRGAEVTPETQAASPYTAQPAGPQPAWRGLLRFAWIPFVGVLLILGFFLSQGQRDLEDLGVGDCFNAADTEEISEVDRQECTEAHQYEVFHVTDWPDADASYPPVTSQDEFVAAQCLPAFAAYVGKPYETSVLDVYILTPSADTWSEGDREFVCALFDPGQTTLTASMRNAGR